MLHPIKNLNKKDHNNSQLWLFYCDTCNLYEERNYFGVIQGRIKYCYNCSPKKYSGEDATLYQKYYKGYSDGNLTFDQFKALVYQNCYWCGKWRPTTRGKNRGKKVSCHGLDRLENDKPHDLSNVKPCCWICNDRKSDASAVEFLQDAYDTVLTDLKREMEEV